jgi:metal-responsive CopG/Arc/MetJ family transcriptional regulator
MSRKLFPGRIAQQIGVLLPDDILKQIDDLKFDMLASSRAEVGRDLILEALAARKRRANSKEARHG